MVWNFIRTEKIISEVEITLGEFSYSYFYRVDIFVLLNAKATHMISKIRYRNANW